MIYKYIFRNYKSSRYTIYPLETVEFHVFKTVGSKPGVHKGSDLQPDISSKCLHTLGLIERVNCLSL